MQIRRKYHRQKFYILMLLHLADHLCKLKTKQAVIPILVELQNLFSSTRKSDHLKQPFAYDFQAMMIMNYFYGMDDRRKCLVTLAVRVIDGCSHNSKSLRVIVVSLSIEWFFEELMNTIPWCFEGLMNTPPLCLLLLIHHCCDYNHSI